MSKIYTKKGDKGNTSLYNGKRVPKYDKRICVIGTIDELVTYIGMLNVSVHSQSCEHIQVILSDIATVIATPESKPDEKLITKYLGELENCIDVYMATTPQLRHFILPSANQNSGWCHICRTVTRRLERELWDVQFHVHEIIRKYINRLSDFFFAYARHLSSGTDKLIKDVRKQMS